jgi:formate-dependent nitrite reductase membrane component NrfD
MVRRPEKGSKPKLFYLGADEAAVNPEATSERRTYMMAESDPAKPVRVSDAIGYVPSGMVQRDYSVAHRRPWGWHVSAYLWTKSIAAGAFLVAALLFLLGGTANSHSLLTVAAPIVSLLFLAATNLLLVLDLERPERFWRVMLWPHWSSWLVVGAYILAAYGAIVTVELIAGALGSSTLYRVLAWPGIVLAAGAAGYSAFLLAQAKGRDLWQSPLLPAHLLAQGVLAGAAVLSVLALPLDRSATRQFSIVLAIALGASLFLILTELSLPHVTAHTRQAIRNMTRGPSALPFWLGAILLGSALPLALAAWVAAGGPAGIMAIAALLALAGLAAYEDMYVRAGQSVPLS